MHSSQEGWAILELENGQKVFADGILKVNEAGKKDA